MKRILLLAALPILNSCIAGTNLGDFVDSIGVQQADFTSLDAEYTKKSICNVHDKSVAKPGDFSIYQLGEAYYMLLYLSFSQKDCYLFQGEDIFANKGKFCKIISGSSKRNLKPYMVLMDSDSVDQCLQIKGYTPPENADALIEKDEFDFEHAEPCTPNLQKYEYNNKYKNYYDYVPRIPEKNSLVHYALKPIAWPLYVVDRIPNTLFFGTLYLCIAPQIIQEQMQLSNAPAPPAEPQ